MKKLRVLILALACLLVLSGCSCKHEWTAADCVTPASCTQCGETEGEALGHTWTDATCTAARTCSSCGRTEGAPLGHSWIDATCTAPKTCSACGEVLGSVLEHTWIDATCTAPKTCSVCGEPEGEPLEHTWLEATTDAPATCSVCGATEGEKVVTDPRFVTAKVESLLGRWESELDLSEDDLEVRRYNGSLEGTFWIEFGNDGTAHSGIVLKDEEAFRAAVAECYADWFFEELEEEDVDEEAANTVAEALLDKSVEEYILEAQREKSADELIKELLAESEYGNGWIGDFVYYVAEEQLYMDSEWKEEMNTAEFEFIGTTLMLYGYLECKPAEAAN